MAQQDPTRTEAQPDTPQKPNLRTLIIGLVLAVATGGGYAGVEAAGYTPDSTLIQSLGIGGAILLIVYFHTVWLPIVRQKGAKLDTIDTKVDAVDKKLDTVLERLDAPKATAAPALHLVPAPTAPE